MEYFVIAPDGSRYGPADVATLSRWALENRVTAASILEGSDGRRYAPAEVPGLVLPTNAPPTAGYAQPGPNVPGYAPYPHHAYSGDNGQGDVTKAWIFGAIGLVFCPILFSVMGMVFANNATKKGNPGGKAAFAFSLATLVIGLVVGALVGSAIRFPR